MKPARSTRIFRRALRGLPIPKHGVGYEPGIRIPVPDGVELLADRYFPDPGGAREFPTLLVRSPYGRGLPWAALFGMAFAEQGFHVVVQSSRGTAGSGGTAQPWRDDGPDGRATVAWLRSRSWFTGRLGLVGPSAMAYPAWALAAEPPPELKAMVMHLPLHNPYGFFYRNGVFALEDALIAATAFDTQHRGPRAFLGATLRLARGMKRIVRAEQPVVEYERVLGRRIPVLAGAAAHPDPSDGYWQGTDLLGAADGLDVPTLIVSGWSDVALEQALQQYGRLPAGRRSLLVGPWTHTSALRQGFGTVFGESVAWLRGHLADPTPPKGRVQVTVGPKDGWRELPAWPPAAVPVSWYPQADGTLARNAPGGDEAVGTVRHDPAHPTPSVGGAGLGRTAGTHDDQATERRPEVLVRTSAPLPEAIEVIGPVAAELLARIPDLDGAATVFVRLCDVDERGRSRNVCDGIARIDARSANPAPSALTITMSSTAHRFLPGHRIRIRISAGAHPRFAAGRRAYEIEVRSGSAVVLPVV
ncbi:CocE/NonD family hydrolase [Catenulispora yoronensis]|uniref:CocE/NonD family hydrolase n=1 Tax=Catenulispora yoronensis TaxID=450799 RepID=A0ABN2TYF6_9ACTN